MWWTSDGTVDPAQVGFGSRSSNQKPKLCWTGSDGVLRRLLDLFARTGKVPQIPLMERGFKQAAREQRNEQPELDL